MSAGQPDRKKASGKAKEVNDTVTLSGCLDQTENSYILAHDQEKLKNNTTLVGRAFSDDNFARFVGHKVRLRGAVKEGRLHVDLIEKIAETCH
jgi:hypothetical protein